jgi:hypothetical protein
MCIHVQTSTQGSTKRKEEQRSAKHDGTSHQITAQHVMSYQVQTSRLDSLTHISVEMKSNVVDGVDVLRPPLCPRGCGVEEGVLRVLQEHPPGQSLQLAARRRVGSYPEGLARAISLPARALLELKGFLAVR